MKQLRPSTSLRPKTLFLLCYVECSKAHKEYLLEQLWNSKIYKEQNEWAKQNCKAVLGKYEYPISVHIYLLHFIALGGAFYSVLGAAGYQSMIKIIYCQIWTELLITCKWLFGGWSNLSIHRLGELNLGFVDGLIY